MSAKLELRELIVEPGARQIKLPSVISSPCYVDLGDDIIVTPRARGGSVFRTSQIAALPSGTTGCEMSLISPDVGRSVPARWRCFGGVIVRSLVLTSAQMWADSVLLSCYEDGSCFFPACLYITLMPNALPMILIWRVFTKAKRYFGPWENVWLFRYDLLSAMHSAKPRSRESWHMR